MDPKHSNQTTRDAYNTATERQFKAPEIALGPWTSYSLLTDPKHMAFVLARYKFCAKLLEGKREVIEVGSGDGFGLPIVAQAVGHLHAVDWDRRLLDGIAKRMPQLTNVTYTLADLNVERPQISVDAAYAIDVIEHIEPAIEAQFMSNVVGCLRPTGILIIGSPSIHASQYASPQSEAAHINLKSHATLRALMEGYFDNVFMFGMNDEVVHTGYAPMCHYIWAIGVGVRSEQGASRAQSE